jgi:hypothetical protein
MYGRLSNTSKQERTMCLKSSLKPIKKQEKSENNSFSYDKGKDLTTCEILILQSSLGNNHYFSRTLYAITILIIQGY